jgi:MraZ protein
MTRFAVGEFRRTLDDRYRVSIPAELTEPLALDAGEEEARCVLAKERPGALSLWHARDWSGRWEADVKLVRGKIEAGRLQDRLADVQVLGRLLSTRHREVAVAGRGRLVVPEGFREFLAVEPGGDVLIVGAAICVEIWKPEAWVSYLSEQIPRFSTLLEELAG